jgi:hypothetical protein
VSRGSYACKKPGAAIGTVTIFGDNIRQLFGASAEALAGNGQRVDLLHGEIEEAQDFRPVE